MGESIPFQGGGEPPRGHYPTSFEVEVQLIARGGSDGGTKVLPTAKCNRMQTPLNTAKEAAEEIGFHNGSVRKGKALEIGEITGKHARTHARTHARNHPNYVT